MKKIKYWLLLIAVIISSYQVNALTSLFESKAVTYAPYDYKRSEFEKLGSQGKLDVMLNKVSELDENQNKFTKRAHHQIVKALHAAQTVENSFVFKQSEKAMVQIPTVVDLKQLKAQKRLQSLKAILQNLVGRDFTAKASRDALFRTYKHIELAIKEIYEPMEKYGI
jgi:hypothetical protein